MNSCLLYTSIAYIALLAILTVPKNGFFRGEDGSVLNGPLITGLVAILIIYFILVGIISVSYTHLDVYKRQTVFLS